MEPWRGWMTDQCCARAIVQPPRRTTTPNVSTPTRLHPQPVLWVASLEAVQQPCSRWLVPKLVALALAVSTLLFSFERFGT